MFLFRFCFGVRLLVEFRFVISVLVSFFIFFLCIFLLLVCLCFLIVFFCWFDMYGSVRVFEV